METVLVVGASGNIGVSAIKAALRSGRDVLAIVRNQASADKLVKHVGTAEGITIVEADVTSDTGVRGVVDQVRTGKLPEFQHVYACVSCEPTDAPLEQITTDQLRQSMNSAFEANFFAYRDTIGYLVSQARPTTWTLCTGSLGDVATLALPGLTQGALFTLATAASRENEHTNVRFIEVYLAFRVEVDEQAAEHGVTSSSEFSKVYEVILADDRIRGARVRLERVEDIETLRWARKF